MSATSLAANVRCPSCGGSVDLATGVVNLTTGVRDAVCWACGQHVTWTFDSGLEVAEYSFV